MVVSKAGTVDIGHGRGRLRPEAAASLKRVDAQFKRAGIADYVDVNSAWRSPITQQQLYEAYQHYLRYGSPWAPIALPPNQSVHCDGLAIDTDHGKAAAGKAHDILVANGWILTVYRWVLNPKTGKYERKLVEPWHREYQKDKDRYYGQPADDGSTPLEDEMSEKAEKQIDTMSKQLDTLIGQYYYKASGYPNPSGPAALAIKDIRAMIVAQGAAIEALAKNAGADPKEIASIVDKAVRQAVDGLEIKLEVSGG